jgi:Protein of unknown function (DUF1552)
MKKLDRRTVLRGMLGGVSIGVALPFLDVFLDTNGRALAGTTQRIPVRFGTWIWGCGFVPERWVPSATGADYKLPPDLEPLEPYKSKIAVFSGYDVKLDGVPNKPHITGCLGLRTGIPVPNETVRAPTVDVIIGDAISKGTRFSSIEVSTSGIERSYSYRAAGSPNPSEVSPLALYQRIFGEGFQDPNAASFKPDPSTMVRKSVLSAVAEDRQRLMRTVGADDRRRLDEYFGSIRHLEDQLALQLQPPARVENFTKPLPPADTAADSMIDNVMATHRVMAGLLAKSLQCNQTKVINVLLSDTTSNLRRAGSTTTHHTLTHEEPVNPALGYQEQVGWFAQQSMVAYREFLDAMAAIPEGDGTLLDNCLFFAHSDCSIAKAHAVEGIPMIVAGGAGGRVRTGFHMAGRADPATRVGLTLQQAMGLQVEKWGVQSMETNRTITELMA